MRHPNTQKLFFGKMCYKYFFYVYEKGIFHHFKICFSQKIVFSNYNTFLIECREGPFLDVNLKTRFFKGQKPWPPICLSLQTLKFAVQQKGR